MTIAYNPKTGEYRSIKNHVEPKDFVKRLKNKIKEVDSSESHLDQNVPVNYDDNTNQNNDPKLSGEDYSNIDHGYLGAGEY